jgi:hypothetical protein
VRYHPNEWHEFSPPASHPRIHWSRPDLEGLQPILSGADQVVVQGTTVGAQAFAAGKRLVGLSFSPMVRRSGMDYAKLGMGEAAASLDEMILALEQGIAMTGREAASVTSRADAAVCVARHILALGQQGASS